MRAILTLITSSLSIKHPKGIATSFVATHENLSPLEERRDIGDLLGFSGFVFSVFDDFSFFFCEFRFRFLGDGGFTQVQP